MEDFETTVAKYTGAPIVVATNSCTNALGIVFEYAIHKLKGKYNEKIGVTAHMPKLTYIGVPMQAARSGMKLDFLDGDWSGEYDIGVTYFNSDDVVCEAFRDSIWDSARRFTKNMWYRNAHVELDRISTSDFRCKCVSFHATKILGHTQGGAILTNDAELKQFAREMRHDGRRFDVNQDKFEPRLLGRHDYMWPDTAAALLYKLQSLSEHNEDLPNSDYPDLSQMEIFK